MPLEYTGKIPNVHPTRRRTEIEARDDLFSRVSPGRRGICTLIGLGRQRVGRPSGRGTLSAVGCG